MGLFWKIEVCAALNEVRKRQEKCLEMAFLG
jgi:hypothetical protein